MPPPVSVATANGCVKFALLPEPSIKGRLLAPLPASSERAHDPVEAVGVGASEGVPVGEFDGVGDADGKYDRNKKAERRDGHILSG